MVLQGAWSSRSKRLDDGELENGGGVEWWPAVAVVMAGNKGGGQGFVKKKNEREREMCRSECVGVACEPNQQGPLLLTLLFYFF